MLPPDEVARLPPPEAYLRPEDKERARHYDLNDMPCTITSGNYVAELPTDQCVRMTPPQRFEGLWRNEYEGSRFCPAPAQECSYSTPGTRVWLSVAERLPQSGQVGRGGLYSVAFVGRRTLHPGRYGHMGADHNEVIVDQFVSIRELEAPPPEPTRAEIREEWRRCEAAGSCTKAENFEEVIKDLK